MDLHHLPHETRLLGDADLLPADTQVPARPGLPALANELITAPTDAARHGRLAAALGAAGFAWLAYGQLTCLGRRPVPTCWYLPHADAAWLRTAAAERHHEVDPRFGHATAACAPWVWDLDTLAAQAAPHGARGRRVVDTLRTSGIASGVWWCLPAEDRPDDHTVIAFDAPTAGRGWITDAVVGQALVIALSVHEFLSTRLPSRAEAPATPALSTTQQGVLDCLCEGHSDKVIAHRLQLSSHAVDYHMRQLRRRFAARNRVQLMHAAIGWAGAARAAMW